MVELIWSIVAILGGVFVVGLVLWGLITGRHDRDKEEAARVYFDEHGHWPDESPSA
jgi:nitrogen fixation-related uncharacterized protein